jgi:outer membrane putative beta-barrel porin/alpha-amylase
MPSIEKPDTHRKAPTVNLGAFTFGSFAEINAGQEVARWFLLAIRTVLVAALSFACLGSAIAQTQEATAADTSAAEASKQAANPLASVWLMQTQQNNTWTGIPANGGNRVQSNLQFQPLLSVKLTDDWSLVTRPVLTLFTTTPFQDQAGRSDRVTGLGDTALAFALSPGHRLVGNWLLAAGPTFIFPTATDSRIGQNTWQVGPAAAIGYTGKNFVTYVFPQQWFSVGGNGRRTRQMSLIYAFVHTFPNGWTVGTNPNMLVDWEASSGNKLTFPVGLQVGKLRKLGPLPVKFDVQVQYYAVRPQFNSLKWNLQFQITPILPALIKRKVF